MENRRVLVVDDDRELCELLVAYLERESFAVKCAHDGEAGLERALSEPYDVLVLDVMLPVLSGFDVLRRLRLKSALPVLMLTARGEDVDRIVGLELGADDYLPKPFNPRELVARIHAILRRTTPSRLDAGADGAAGRPRAALPPIVLGELAVHPDRREAMWGGRTLPLTTVEFDVLIVLARGAGRAVSRAEISKEALGRAHTPYDRSVDMHVMNLRRKLQPAAGGGLTIKTVRSAGYMLVVPPPSSRAASAAVPSGGMKHGRRG